MFDGKTGDFKPPAVTISGDERKRPPREGEGRPFVFTPEIRDRILENIRIGVTIKDAVLAEGISRDTFRNWRMQYPGLNEDIEIAKAQGASKLVKSLSDKALIEGDTKAIIWLLSLRGYTPKSLTSRGELPGQLSDNTGRTINVDQLTGDEKKRLGSILLASDDDEFQAADENSVEDDLS